MTRLLLILLFPLALLGQTRSVINTGSTANDGTGDSLRTFALKSNTNFSTLWASVYTNGVDKIGTNIVLAGPTVFDGNLTNGFEIGDIDQLTLDGVNTGVYGVQSLFLDGGITTLRGVTNLNVITPNVGTGSATAGQFLRLSDAVEGTVEFETVSTTDATKLPLAGGTMSGALNMGSQKIASVANGTASTDAINLGQLDERITVDQSLDTIILNPASNFIDDPAVTTSVIAAASGSQPSRIGSSNQVNLSFTSSGIVAPWRTYKVTGTGTVVYNGTTNASGTTFSSVYGVRTFTATGSAKLKDLDSATVDSGYTSGNASVATISGGYDHLNNQLAGTIAGGGHNELRSGGSHGFIGSGSLNIHNGGNYGAIVAGSQNTMSQEAGGIFVGTANLVSDPVVASARSIILSGFENQISDLGYSTVINGYDNRILNTSAAGGSGHSIIISGYDNTIDNGQLHTAQGRSISIQGTSALHDVVFGNGIVITNATYALTHGLSNQIAAVDNVVAFGQANSIADIATPVTRADYSFAQGFQAVARSWGQRVESNGNESAVNVQRSRYILKRRAAHTTGVNVQLRLDGSQEFPYTPTNSVWTCRATITAVQSDGVKYGSWTLDFAVRDTGGVLSILGSPTSVVVFNGHSTTWTVAAGVRSDASNRGIVLNAQALTGETVTWGAALDAMELNGAW